jgi:hypothetical protein
MNNDELKTEVLRYIHENPRCSFAELESQVFDKSGYQYQGKTALTWGDQFLWSGWNRAAFSIILDLYYEGQIHFNRASSAEICSMKQSRTVCLQSNKLSLRWFPTVISVLGMYFVSIFKIKNTAGTRRRK